jgi:Uma2 family endonuclease
MSAVPKTFITPQEYLKRERAAEFRSEYYKGEMFAMAGATYAHTLIKDNFSGELRNQFKGTDCVSLTSDMRTKVDATGLYTYPDVVIVCGGPRFEDDVFDTLLNAQVVIEVSSDSTGVYDRSTKFRHYRQVPSMKEYVIAAQDRPLVERYVRHPDESWVLTEYRDLSQTFEFATVAVKIPLAEIYRGVKFAEKQG